jgi:dihydrodipicolinate synthase/N-acetylneuraminate lyase
MSLPPPGYMPALITPFKRNGDLDEEAHVRNVRRLAQRGIGGFVLGGSNGEGPFLEPGDRGRLVKSIRRRKTHIMAGIAAESVRQALAAVEETEDAGADTLLVMTPTTLSRGREVVVQHFYETIADGATRPVFLYSVPMVTAYSMPIATITKLAQHENIVGMKDSSGDVVRLQSIIDATPDDFILYSGSSKALTAAIAVGCDGAITGSGNYVPELVLETMATARESPKEARGLQRRLSALSSDIEGHGVPGVKAAAKAAGLEPGYPRAPLTRLPRGVETSIAKQIP